MDTQKLVYIEEAHELLGELEDALVELEHKREDRDLIDRIFRAMHTIKGSGAMFGYDDIAAFTHTIETVYDCIREDTLKVTEDLISLTLSSCDQIKVMLDASQGLAQKDETQIRKLAAAFEGMTPGDGETAVISESGSSFELFHEDDQRQTRTFRIRFMPHEDLFKNGSNPALLLKELCSLGKSRIFCHHNKIPGIREIDPEKCYVSWDIILTAPCDINAIRDVFIFVEDISKITIEIIDDTAWQDDDYQRLGEILCSRGEISEAELETILPRQKRIGEILVDSGIVEKTQVQSALLEQDYIRTLRKKHSPVEAGSSIRVASNKLDSLVNMVGELVTVQARLTQFSAQSKDPDLTAIAEEVERLSADLRDNAMEIRMLPIGTMFAKFKRLVRDLSTDLGKEIMLTTQGAETELDKTVIEKLGDPLIHLIRNSADHGIEMPDFRIASGKPRAGRIHLCAVHSGTHVLVSIQDDGAGLDSDAIRAKAVERGLIKPDALLSLKEVYDLILAPGFSTSDNITSISGRGVGMDVVTSSIESLGGAVDISSVKGKGTTITLRLPLTIAIIDGLLVSIGDDFFVIPLDSVLECMKFSPEDTGRARGRYIVRVRDKIVPYIYLREIFAINGSRPGTEQIVITGVGEHQVGFVVDKVIGKHQTVIKHLGRLVRDIKGISGATIMGDGTVALILDIHKLICQAEQAA